MISIRKRGNTYQYYFEAVKVDGKRKQIANCGFKAKNEAYTAVQKAYDEFIKELGNYKLSVLTPYILNQTSNTIDASRNYQKVIKSSLRDAKYYFGFIQNNPASSL